MSDETTTTDDTDRILKQLAEMRQRISDLEERVDDLETGRAPDARAAGGLDRYDGYVLDKVAESGRTNLGIVRGFYREAGVRDPKKIKRRVKFLHKTGRLAQAARDAPQDDEGGADA